MPRRSLLPALLAMAPAALHAQLGSYNPPPGPQGTIAIRGARIVTVSDAEIAAAIRAYWQDTHNLAEGAGAAPLAALMQDAERMRGKRVGLVLCGGNIDLELFRRWVLGAA